MNTRTPLSLVLACSVFAAPTLADDAPAVWPGYDLTPDAAQLPGAAVPGVEGAVRDHLLERDEVAHQRPRERQPVVGLVAQDDLVVTQRTVPLGGTWDRGWGTSRRTALRPPA